MEAELETETAARVHPPPHPQPRRCRSTLPTPFHPAGPRETRCPPGSLLWTPSANRRATSQGDLSKSKSCFLFCLFSKWCSPYPRGIPPVPAHPHLSDLSASGSSSSESARLSGRGCKGQAACVRVLLPRKRVRSCSC